MKTDHLIKTHVVTKTENIINQVTKSSQEILKDEVSREAAKEAAMKTASESMNVAQRFVKTFAAEIKKDFGSTTSGSKTIKK